MTPISKNMYIDKNQGIYLMNPAMNGTIKMKPYDVNYSTCIDFGKKQKSSEKDRKYEAVIM